MCALRVLGAAGAVVLAVLAGCGGGASVNHAPTSSPCEIRLAPTGQPADTITVAVFDPIDFTHAPTGRNRAERFLFGHLYETLITVDCHGEILPALASSWSEEDSGFSCVFELRDGARFWDGSPVTARDVARSFRDASVDSASVIDDHHVKVSLLERGAIQRLSLPVFAVTKPLDPLRAPLGTGSWRVDDPNVDTTVTVVIRPSFGAKGPMVHFVESDASDARDLFDEKIDAIVTGDPVVIEYASTRPGTATAPLWWDQVYVLLSTSRVLAVSKGERVEDIPQTLCDALARDAVRAEARGGSSLIADSKKMCGVSTRICHAPTPFFADARRVLYDAGDATARDLAERIVALAAMDTTTSSQAREIVKAVPGLTGGRPNASSVGVAQIELEASLRQGSDFAYVLALPDCTRDLCVALHLKHRATWLVTGDVPLVRAVMPLVETRARLIVANDRVGIIDDGQGGVRIMNPALERPQ